MGRMKRVRRMAMGLILVCLAACTAAVAGTTTATTQKSTVTQKPGPTPTRTVTASPTMQILPTLAPMAEPTPGPKPDVELLNVMIRGRGQNSGWFYGEIRNNTDKEVIFPGRELNFHFIIDYFGWWQGPEGSIPSTYVSRDFYLWPSGDRAEISPCYLFPGETGVIAFRIYEQCHDESEYCHITEEYGNTPPPSVGYQLRGYEIKYRKWEEYLTLWDSDYYPKVLSPDLHLQAEDIEYEIKRNEQTEDGDAILIRFSINYKKADEGYIAEIPIWVVLYDGDGRIINVLHKENLSLCEGKGCLKDGRYSVALSGCNGDTCQPATWAGEGEVIQQLNPGLELTREDLARTQRIRVFIEVQSQATCGETFR